MRKQIALLLLCSAMTSPAMAEVLKDISIEGTRRIEDATVMNYLRLKKGQNVSESDVDAATKTLFATGLFSDVDIRLDKGVAKIKVEENPIVHRVFFEGNSKMDDDALKTEIVLKPRTVYTQRKLQSDAARLVDVYKRNGRFAATVTPKIIPQDQNRVDVVFEIDEGARTEVRKINITGNNAFSESVLQDKMMTKEAAWYRFLTSTDTYDPDRLNYDQELLRRFYMQNGYVDFRVNSAVAELLPDKSGFVITIDVTEGDRYRFGKPEVKVSLPEYEEKEKLSDLIEFEEKDIFDISKVDLTVDELTEAVENQGYAFAEVEPQFKKDEKTKTVDVKFQIAEGQKVFIDKIQINGNSRTLDKVIRREFRIKEGDAFNSAKLRRSKQRVEDLDYFGRVELKTEPTRDPSKVNAVLDVAEKSTGAFSVGIGWSSYDGMMFETGIQERNVLGTGNIFGVNAMLSQKETQYTVGLTNPYFLDKNLTAGIDLFHTTRDNSDSSSYSYDSTGGTIRFGWDYTDHFRQTARYTLRQDDINDVDSDASLYIKEQKGKNVVSLVGQELIYDRRDSRINPTTGYYTSLGTDIAGLGGDSKFFRVNVTGIKYFSVAEEVVLSLRGDAGRIWGLSGKKVRINDRYFLGDVSLRGFEYGGVGARDRATDDSLGGLWYATTTAELVFPVGLPKELGIKGKVFSDAGWIGKPDDYNPNTMVYSDKTRLAVGTGILWQSPMGMINLDFSYPILKTDYDKKRVFRLNFGKGF
ncbi:MAG: outer membrane protein assembly factor BamA [Alphaproteobacteria bacterium]|nr:outer membrane protein assembly factor BamA [Alphaproteobacteria bacterium]